MRPHEYLTNRLDVLGEHIDMGLLFFDERALYYYLKDESDKRPKG